MGKKGKERGKVERPSRSDSNYDFKQHAPRAAMGHGSFANLPREAMFRSFSGKVNMRGGIQNNPVMSVDMISGVDENMRENYGDDSA